MIKSFAWKYNNSQIGRHRNNVDLLKYLRKNHLKSYQGQSSSNRYLKAFQSEYYVAGGKQETSYKFNHNVTWCTLGHDGEEEPRAELIRVVGAGDEVKEL